eukprot:5118441-Pyramimonas_sp.AAC.1
MERSPSGSFDSANHFECCARGPIRQLDHLSAYPFGGPRPIQRPVVELCQRHLLHRLPKLAPARAVGP